MYSIAFLAVVGPLLTLSWLGASTATEVLFLTTAAYAILQTIAFSLYLYSAELYPTRLRASGFRPTLTRLAANGWALASFKH